MIYSHTIVKNGSPFLEPVLRNVEPFVHKMLVTVSEKSTDGTMDTVQRLKQEFGDRLVFATENTTSPGELTTVRQKQLDETPKGAWVLFLDDDDWWPEKSLKDMTSLLTQDVDGFGIRPYQLIDKQTHDDSWRNRYFTKFFLNQEGVHYRHPWPRDLIYKNEEMLYWRKNPRVPRVPVRFIHLSYLKGYSFRNETWANEYGHKIGDPESIPLELYGEIDKIWKIMH